MEYLALIVVWILGAIYGWFARERHAIRTLDRLLTEVEESISEEVNDSIIPIIIEKHNNILFVYNKDTNEFMGQGETRLDLEKTLNQRYPDKKFSADKENLRLLK